MKYKYKPYPSYKDSWLEWLGDVPEHWDTSRLKFLCDITTGGKDTENKVDDGQYPFYVRSQTVERINSYSYNGEAILTAGDGVGVGKVFHYTTGKFDFHQRVYMFYHFKRVAGRFLFEYIKNNFYKVALAGVAKSTVDSLRLPLIQNFMITVPPLQEQQAIVNYLDSATAKIDILIEKQTKLIALLKEKRQAVISTAVTRGLDNTVAMKDSGVEWLGEIPEHWEVKKLKNSARIQGGKDQKAVLDDNGKYPVYGSGGIFGYANKYLHNGESVLLGRKGTVDKPLYVHDKFWTVDTMYYTVIEKTTVAKWLYYSATTINFDYYQYGSAVPSMTQEDLHNIHFATPDKNEQQVIVDYLDTKTTQIDSLVSKATKAIELLKEKRTALISSAVTGKIDVREIV